MLSVGFKTKRLIWGRILTAIPRPSRAERPARLASCCLELKQSFPRSLALLWYFIKVERSGTQRRSWVRMGRAKAAKRRRTKKAGRARPAKRRRISPPPPPSFKDGGKGMEYIMKNKMHCILDLIFKRLVRRNIPLPLLFFRHIVKTPFPRQDFASLRRCLWVCESWRQHVIENKERFDFYRREEEHLLLDQSTFRMPKPSAILPDDVCIQ